MIKIFLHVAVFDDKTQWIVDEIFQYLKESWLQEKADYIYVWLIGGECNFPNDKKIIVKWCWNDVRQYEFPTLKILKEEAKKEECNMLYIHTKWSANSDDFTRANVRRKMLDVVVDRYQECLDNLRYFDTVWLMYRPDPTPHFSWNMRWATNKFINTLPDFTDKQCLERVYAEFRLLQPKKFRKRKTKFYDMISRTFI